METVFNVNAIRNLISEAYGTAVSKGWHDSSRGFPEVIALIHSEITEVVEAVTDSDNFYEELADILIRVFDACGEFELDLATAFEQIYLQGSYVVQARDHGALMELHLVTSRALEKYRSADKELMWKEVTEQFALLVWAIKLFWSNEAVSAAVYAKMERNKNRPHRHGNKRA